jgi:hypothetical protein
MAFWSYLAKCISGYIGWTLTVEMCIRHCVKNAKWGRVLVACEDLGAFEWVHGLRFGGL